MLIPYQETSPRIHPSVFIAPGTMIIGDVTIGEESSVWFNCVLRGDLDRIEVGTRTNIQDSAVVHLDKGFPCIIGDDVTVGHGAIVHGCTIGNGALIGIGAIILSGAKIGEGAMVAAGALVREGQDIPPKTLAVGLPAQIRRDLTEVDLERMRLGKEDYVSRGQIMRAALTLE
ncbi:MAG: gamma carbonic anhydrase family protein [Candidatus Poribacteria bacterium]|nr:gamma carbonic anhydrase family protein [Candidatus Poribacteria bacterium]